jgi:hypothetical protein
MLLLPVARRALEPFQAARLVALVVVLGVTGLLLLAKTRAVALALSRFCLSLLAPILWLLALVALELPERLEPSVRLPLFTTLLVKVAHAAVLSQPQTVKLVALVVARQEMEPAVRADLTRVLLVGVLVTFWVAPVVVEPVLLVPELPVITVGLAVLVFLLLLLARP